MVRTERELVMASGEIETSLFAATDRVGLGDSVAVELADIFSSEVDFHRDLRPGDHFSVVYEALYSDGEFIRTGRIVAAEFTNDGRVHRAVYFEDPQGHGGFYTPGRQESPQGIPALAAGVLPHQLRVHDVAIPSRAAHVACAQGRGLRGPGRRARQGNRLAASWSSSGSRAATATR